MPGAKTALLPQRRYTPRRHQDVSLDTDLPRSTTAIFVGVGGTVRASMWGDEATEVFATYLNVPNGSVLEGNYKQVSTATTTATNMVALYVNN